MSQILKAVELAKKEGNFVQKDPSSKEANAIGDSILPGTNKITANARLLKKNKVLSAIGDQNIIDSYGLLRTRILRRMQQNKWKSIGITSSGKDNGKTLTAINLGISIARKQNYTVVVVDADLRKPSLHKLFGFEPRFGLSDYLTSDIAIDKILLDPGIDRLIVVPGNKRTEASSELLSSHKMSRLTQDLKTRYPSRIVIYDLPPVLVGDDVAAFAPNLDTALLVVEEGGTEADKLKRSIDLLEGVEIIGTVMNKSTSDTLTEAYYY